MSTHDPLLAHAPEAEVANAAYARADRALLASLASLDRDDAEVIEARLFWGETLLGVRHVGMKESLDVGSAFGAIEGVDDVKIVHGRLQVPNGMRVERHRAGDLQKFLVVFALRVIHDVVHHAVDLFVVERLDVDAANVAVDPDHGRQAS